MQRITSTTSKQRRDEPTTAATVNGRKWAGGLPLVNLGGTTGMFGALVPFGMRAPFVFLKEEIKMINITLPDGSVKSYDAASISPMEIAKSLSNSLPKKAVAAKVNGEVCDLSTVLDKDAEVAILTFDDEEGKEVFRHSSSHVLAEAVQRLWPGTKIAIGPAIENGFYYDFDSEHTFVPEDLEKIEKEMKKIVKAGDAFERREVSREEALKFFSDRGENYKVELIEDLPEDETISMYQDGDYVDLCAGPHLPKTSAIKAIKLMSIAGAYWRGDEKNKMLQRIYGTSFPKQDALDEYLHLLEEAKRRDHRKLGKELDLFSFVEEAPGFPIFHPKGMILRNELEKFWREEHEKAGYSEIRTPLIMNRALWERSGHWDHYKENMYFTEIDEQPYAIKPMNCPGGILLYNESLHSYRELPLRWAELGLVHRHELSGALHGLMRVRAFTQDDAHIFMREDQIIDEVVGVMKLVDRVYSKFGFDYHMELSTRPEDSMGSDELWEKATEGLRTALQTVGKDYIVNPGDGAFYGPKIDFHLKDCLGRTWQCGTIQLDFQMPLNFGLEYIAEDGSRQRPIMIHRVCFGSIERFIGILTEHFAGKFPTWLAPTQVKVLPVSDKSMDYAKEVYEALREKMIRCELDTRNEKIGYKIREAQSQKIPYMLVLGDKEAENDTISVRTLSGEQSVESLADFIARLQADVKSRKS